MILWILVLIFSFGLSSGNRFTFKVGLNLFQPSANGKRTFNITLQTSNQKYSIRTNPYSGVEYFSNILGPALSNPNAFNLLENEVPKNLIITDSFTKAEQNLVIAWNNSAAAVGISILGGSLKLTYSFQVAPSCKDTGNYKCGSNHRKICKKNWMNPNKNCTAPNNCPISCYQQTACFNINTGKCICYFKNGKNILTKGPPKCDKKPPLTCTTGHCQNGGRCKNSSEGFGCLCKFGFSGENCELKTCPGGDSILRVDCTANATCKVKSIGTSCTCRVGSAGRYCVIAGKSCESDTCLNGGTCNPVKAQGNRFLCYCKVGFGGARCQNAHKFCDMTKTLCGKREICLNMIGNHRCIKMPTNTKNSTLISNDTTIV